ncbi:hypothetical protein HGRIS_004965 [Hohenbuehelia grisea]|uniref:Uncharacterized protein n=1 Tax=Hohenbuehelia grisea TaxID=104357 RepID=A0ABR3JDZ9_9AGAR
MSVVFCFLINRVYFVRDRNIATATVSKTRATLCEILAIRVLRENANDLLKLTLATTTSWSVYCGADPVLLDNAREERQDDLEERVGNAIEMAIISKARRFIKSSSCQKVIDAIWSGKCVYQAQSSHSILSDTYKRNPIHFYDPHKAPLLDHYRLKVPAIRSVLEYLNFLILFILFVIAIEVSERDVLNTAEVIFMIYALGFTLEKIAAMQEHGIKVYFKGTWNGFDLAFVSTFLIYVFLRIYGVYHHSLWARSLGIDCLALIACLMFPRLAFVTLKNNLMVLSLRAMMVQFTALMLIAAFCFCGFLYALWTLSRNQAGYSASTIALWMADLWFGLDASGFDNAVKFHPLFGPVLMVTYACLSNTLLLTVLVSILSNTFATINEDAAAEAMFRKAVSTIEGVKADFLFSYQPPINLLALCIMLPASYILSPRWFHKVNVFMIRATSFPVLLIIAFYERQAKKTGSVGFYDTFSATAERVFETLPRHLKRMTFFEGLAGADADIDAVFEIEEESESALDINDYPGSSSPLDVPTQSPHRRRSSQASGRPKFAPSSSPKQNNQSKNGKESEESDESHQNQHRFPRARVASLLNEATNAVVSPLAQIFQPLIVDDAIPEEPEGPVQQNITGQGASPPAPLISYGPASRRRLSSVARRPTHLHGDVHGPGAGLRKLPSTSPSAPGGAGGARLRAGQEPLSESPGLMDSESVSSPGIETAMQVEKDEESAEGPSQWSRRLARMEERQARIEALLERISGKLETDA